jgi:cytoskeleton protein RodZ
MTEAGNEAQASGLGERLARGRERRGLALLQAAEKLHLEPRVVEALESEDFDSLGAAVYVRGHLQRYAELVGENAAELQALYAGRPHAHSTPDLRQVITERNRGAVPGARFGVWQGGLLTLALVLAALVWWALRSRPVDTDTVVVQTPPADAAVTPAAGVQGPAPATTTTRSAAAPVGGTARASTPAPRVVRPTTAVPVAAARPGEPSAALTTTPTPSAAPAIAPAGPSTAAPAANAARLVLSFREDSWAEVYDASGAALYRDIATAGAVQTVSGVPPLRLVLGNAAGVGINLDGRTVTLGAALQSTPNAQFMLDRGGRVTETP